VIAVSPAPSHGIRDRGRCHGATPLLFWAQLKGHGRNTF
jgi:hypothetical protein